MSGSSRVSAALHAEQALASDPAAMVWLSASAGTGKTFVLAVRVLRLLLRGVAPDAILCLTFTTAGAAEMANRINATLAHWVRLPDSVLALELKNIAEGFDPQALGIARRLFARVLEAKGGGLRIMTIHAFCQTLLASFPLEAGMTPGFKPLEGRDQTQLAQQVLADLVTDAELRGDTPLLDAVKAMSIQLGEVRSLAFLVKAATAPDVLAHAGEDIAERLAEALGVGDFDAKAACRDADVGALRAIAAMYAQWTPATGRPAAERIEAWFAADADERLATLDALHALWRTGKGTPPKNGPKHPDFEELRERLAAWSSDIRRRLGTARMAAQLGLALFVAGRYARAYDAAKRVRGVVDFDDLIRDAAALLTQSGMGEWIRYKLDQATDHILVDEAQDTNTAQWAIIASIAAEFFAGAGARGDADRSLFTVGDYKQAIYGFQGTDPVAYAAARQVFAGHAVAGGREITEVALNRSFRSAPAILEVVDRVVAEVGHEAMGIADAPAPHVSHRGGFGSVMLLPPPTTQDDPDRAISDDGDEGWIPDVERRLASSVARFVKTTLDRNHATNKPGEQLRAGDVMILLRSRGELASLVVARLHAAGVPVAGVDRLRLQAPLAVKDLLAAMRFAVQPSDDLTLAALLVSPIFGWSQDRLFEVAYDRAGSLWQAVGATDAGDALRGVLNDADRISPFAFLETLLSGPLQARAKLIGRLGAEARDPVDQLLGAALDYGATHVPSLQGFIDWFDTNDGEIKRDADAGGDAVRVMTVHGAKGLQAKLVILADACANPDDKREQGLDWFIDELGATLPIPRPVKDELPLVASLERQAAEADKKALSEHWRLLYVALTRAEERLVVTGALGAKATKAGGPPERSWYALVARALAALPATTITDAALWDAPIVALEHGKLAEGKAGKGAATVPAAIVRPAWLDRAAPIEARPLRPLAPSAIGVDDVANPPGGAAMAAAAERGVLLHGLFERLPAVARERRAEIARRWLGEVADADELIASALGVIDAYPALFASDSLAEAPVAGIVGTQVIAGTVDRLIVRDDGVDLIDFKTGRRVPAGIDAIAPHHVAQMAAYGAVLRQIFPDRPVRAALLYSAGPVLHVLPDELLAAHAPDG